MSMDPNRWLNTLPNFKPKLNDQESSLDSQVWINTVPQKKIIKTNPQKKYSITIIVFIIGLFFVSLIKNETRNLQKEISNLRASIKNLNLDLHQTILEQDFITSPENISLLAKEHLEFDFTSYKKSQIKHLNGSNKTANILEEKKQKKIFKEKNKKKTKAIKLHVVKKIKKTKTELRKLQELYSNPEQLPGEIRIRIAKKIKSKKEELNKLYSDPYSMITSRKVQQWAGLQVVKVFLGMPIIPGR